jgi:hypothetical protein
VYITDTFGGDDMAALCGKTISANGLVKDFTI